MATAAELLAGRSTTDKTLVVDNYLRTINIPSSIQNLGVENDDEVLRLEFKMPRYLGETDLSKFEIRINYLNSNGEDDVYDVDDAEVLGDNIVFSWLVGPIATRYKGNTKFNVCMKIVDSEGYVQKEYNTTPASLPVLEGLETDARIFESYPDILEQWKNQLFGIGDTEETRLSDVSAEEQQKIVDKASEVLESIPEDYQTTYALADNANRTKADAVRSTAIGETIVIGDCTDDHLRGLRIFGKTTQTVTTGRQLASVNINVADYVMHGVMCSATDDGNIVISGNATGDVWNRLASAELVAGETYTLSSNSALLITVWDSIANTDILTKPAGVNYITFTARNTGMHMFVLANKAYALSTNVRADLMVNVGNTAYPWEPYSGEIASPAPTQPQRLVNAENVDVVVYGNNLFPITETSAYNINAYPQSDGSILHTGTSNGNAWHVYQNCPIYVDGVYTLSVETSNKTSKGSLIQIIDNNGLIGRSWQNTVNKFSCTFEAVAGGTVRWSLGILPDEVVNTKVKLMLNPGKVSYPWEPYVGIQKLSTTNSILRGIPVSQNGNYTDANGQQWVCDEIDFERGVRIQRIGYAEYNGTETWLIGEQDADAGYIGVFYTARNDMVPGSNAICSHYKQSVSVGLVGKYGLFDTYYSQFRVNIGSFNSVNEWCAQLHEWSEDGTPLALSYILTNPIESKLTASELASFAKLHTNSLNTIVMNDSGAELEVSYNVDTSSWVNNAVDTKIAEAFENVGIIDPIFGRRETIYPYTHFETEHQPGHHGWDIQEGVIIKLDKPLVVGKRYVITYNGMSHTAVAEAFDESYYGDRAVRLRDEKDNWILYNEGNLDQDVFPDGTNTFFCGADWEYGDTDLIFKPFSLGIEQAATIRTECLDMRAIIAAVREDLDM